MKRILIWLAAFFAFGAICFIWIFASTSLLPIHDDLQTNRLQEFTGEHSILTLTAETDEGSYTISPSAEFANVFSFNTWEACKKQRNAETLFVLHLGPQVTLTVSPDGYVAAHHVRYSVGRGKSVNPNAYYSISPATANDILVYIQEYGTPQT